ncbi:hypothetical protein D9619_013024 [Psilocybe cf. subviscida]|uniref:Uncharacterized protein n=1 Tax=Psilocybe cf. subviscida TaxID=2480587 RepID=A0A8H5AZC0_9AGAR|nr:hypothetical protein D9619_013024 [Psilocybe cf. subviscida]
MLFSRVRVSFVRLLVLGRERSHWSWLSAKHIFTIFAMEVFAFCNTWILVGDAADVESAMGPGRSIISFFPGFRGPRDKFMALKSFADPIKPSLPQDAISELSERFIDLGSLKANYRLSSLSKGQKYTSAVPLNKPRYKSKSRAKSMSGNQLSVFRYPPEPRGEDFRKWILVMETLFPNRAAYSRATVYGRST